MKVFVCHCEQCRFVKNKRKNRKYKKQIRRLASKKMQKEKKVMFSIFIGDKVCFNAFINQYCY